MASEQQPGGDPTSPRAPSPSEGHETAIFQNPNRPPPLPPPPGVAALPRDLHLHLPVVSSSSSSLVKLVESQEQPAPRLHRPIATQAEVGGVSAFIATATATASHNSSFQASSAPCTHTMSGFAPFAQNNNINNAEHYLRGPPPPLQQGQRQQPQINIGLTIPLKTVSTVVPPATSMIKPFSATDSDHCANEARDKCVDNALVVTVQDRKVRLSNTGSDSLYALCRCWVRSDIPRKDQLEMSTRQEMPLPMDF